MLLQKNIQETIFVVIQFHSDSLILSYLLSLLFIIIEFAYEYKFRPYKSEEDNQVKLIYTV